MPHNNSGTIDFYIADLLSATDYYPFGMVLPGRSLETDKYRFGFNGKEKDSEFSNESYDFGARIYDGRIARWLSVDPLAAKYPDLSAYSFVANMPIIAVDPDGRIIVIKNLSETQTKIYNLAMARLRDLALKSPTVKKILDDVNSATFTVHLYTFSKDATSETRSELTKWSKPLEGYSVSRFKEGSLGGITLTNPDDQTKSDLLVNADNLLSSEQKDDISGAALVLLDEFKHASSIHPNRESGMCKIGSTNGMENCNANADHKSLWGELAKDLNVSTTENNTPEGLSIFETTIIRGRNEVFNPPPAPPNNPPTEKPTNNDSIPDKKD